MTMYFMECITYLKRVHLPTSLDAYVFNAPIQTIKALLLSNANFRTFPASITTFSFQHA